MKLKTTMVITSEPPHARNAARAVSVRRAFQVTTTPATSSSSAAGRSQEIWLPISELNIRSMPVSPHWLPPPPIPPPPPTLPVSSPLIRPSPL